MRAEPKISREEIELVLRAKKGDKQAYEELVSKYTAGLFRYLYRMSGNAEDAEDILQESLASAYRHLYQFRGRSLFSTWLYRIAINFCCKSLRTRSLDCFHNKVCLRDEHNLSTDGIKSVEPSSRDSGPLQGAIEADIIEKVRLGLANLPKPLAEVVTLRELENCSYQEISQRLNIPRGTVMSRLYRGRLKLAKILKKQGLGV
jgi:RNA polymerase sigma-70 factor (ECF subfamily)